MKKRLLITLMVCSLAIGAIGCSNNDKEAADNVTDTPVESSQEDASAENDKEALDAESYATVDGATSASIVQEDIVQSYEAKGFTDGDAKKALFVVGDPRKDSVNYDLVYTAMKHFEDNGVEVELRDLYDIEFNPVLSKDNFFYAKDGYGEPSPEIKTEQEFVTQADYIMFCYPNWHDTPTSIVKGYMETVFAKQFAYKDTDQGLEGMLEGKAAYTIMNAGYLGGGRGDIGDGVGNDDETWDMYMEAFKVFDDDTADFWGLTNKGRFVNDRTPGNVSETHAEDMEKLREDLRAKLDIDFFK